MVATDPRRDVRGVSIVSISTSPQIARRDVGALGDDGSNGDVHRDVHDCNDNVEEDSKQHPRRGHVFAEAQHTEREVGGVRHACETGGDR